MTTATARVPGPRTFAVFMAALLALGLAGLVAPPSLAKGPAAKVIAFTVTLKPKYMDTHKYPPNSYGVNVLTGSTRIARKTVYVERESVFNYIDGSGPITGFVTLKWKDSKNLLAFNVTGQSQVVQGVTEISANLNSFLAMGAYNGKAAFGSMTGTRTGPIGSPVKYTFNITIKDVLAQ
jgi:hypothetical protein